jgi:small subunit ribosomal protein S1
VYECNEYNAKPSHDKDEVNFESALENYLNADFGELDEAPSSAAKCQDGKEHVLSM